MKSILVSELGRGGLQTFQGKGLERKSLEVSVKNEQYLEQ